MPRITQLLYICLLMLASIGCEFEQPSEDSTPAVGKQTNLPPPPPTSPPQVHSAAESPSTPLSPAGQAPRNDAAIAAPSHSSRKLNILLSTGVALAQTGPDGTLMSFSVDYEFAAAPPVAAARYALVVQRGDGQSVMNQETLQRAGNLALLVPGWRGEVGPFYGYIVELNANDEPIGQSDRIELTSP